MTPSYFNYSGMANSEFAKAVDLLNGFVPNSYRVNASELRFSKSKYGDQSVIQTALNILNKAAIEGDRFEHDCLAAHEYKNIKTLNQLLSNHDEFVKKATEIGFTKAEADAVRDYQIALPQTTLERLIEIITLIPRIVISILGELAALISAGTIAIPLDTVANLNPPTKSPHQAQPRPDAKEDPLKPFGHTNITGVICLNSPVRGTPTLDLLCNPKTLDARYKDMSIDSKWRQELFESSQAADRAGKLAVYTYGSTLDPACPSLCHVLSDNPTRNMTVTTEGHLGTMVSPRAISFMRDAINKIDPTGLVPVLQLHGSSAGQYQFTAMRMLTGRTTFTVDYAESRFSNDPNKSIHDYSHGDKIKNIFKDIYEATGSHDVIVVGHSMGGVVGLDIARTIRDSNHSAAVIQDPSQNRPVAVSRKGYEASLTKMSESLKASIDKGVTRLKQIESEAMHNRDEKMKRRLEIITSSNLDCIQSALMNIPLNILEAHSGEIIRQILAEHQRHLTPHKQYFTRIFNQQNFISDHQVEAVLESVKEKHRKKKHKQNRKPFTHPVIPFAALKPPKASKTNHTIEGQALTRYIPRKQKEKTKKPVSVIAKKVDLPKEIVAKKEEAEKQIKNDYQKIPTKTRKLIGFLKSKKYKLNGGTKHASYSFDTTKKRVPVPRHAKIKKGTSRGIMKQALNNDK